MTYCIRQTFKKHLLMWDFKHRQFSQLTFENISIWSSAAYLAKELEDSWNPGWIFLPLFCFFLPGSSAFDISSSLRNAVSTSFCFFFHHSSSLSKKALSSVGEWTRDLLNLKNYFMWTPLRTPMQDKQLRRNNKDKTVHLSGWKLYT